MRTSLEFYQNARNGEFAAVVIDLDSEDQLEYVCSYIYCPYH